MRIFSRSIVKLLLSTALALSALICANAQVAPRETGNATRRVYTVRIGPRDSLDTITKVRGQIAIVAIPDDAEQSISVVEFRIDSTSIGQSNQKPFRVEYDTAKIRDGTYTIKAVGRDSSGREVWGAATRVEVANSVQEKKPHERNARSGREIRTRLDRAEPSAKKRTPTNVPMRRQQVPRSPSLPRTNPGTVSSEQFRALPKGIVLDQEYKNAFQGFSIKYPRGWTFEDQTAAMNPKSNQDFWIQFGTYPIDKSEIVVNVRRVRLEPGTDAQGFLRRNSYAKDWERKTVLGCPAFACTSRILAPKPAVVHRLIIISDGYAWMLNCTDYGGKAPEVSLAIFENMIASLNWRFEKPSPKQAN